MGTTLSHGPHWKSTVNLLITSVEMKWALVTAIVLAMTGWVYALGWVVLKLI
jgi:hypothetical protein